MGEIYFPVSIAGLDEYLYCMETLISADPSKIPLLGDALVIAGTVCFAFSNVGEVSMPYVYLLLSASATASHF